jgi:hypothetical protein
MTSDTQDDVLMELSDEAQQALAGAQAVAGSSWLTVAEAAKALDVSRRSVQRKCAAGVLVARLVNDKAGQHWEVAADATGAPLMAVEGTIDPTTPATGATSERDAPTPNQTTQNDNRDRGKRHHNDALC